MVQTRFSGSRIGELLNLDDQYLSNMNSAYLSVLKDPSKVSNLHFMKLLNLLIGKLQVSFDEKKIATIDLVRAVESFGYGALHRKEEMEKVERMSKTVANLEAGLKKRGDYDKALEAVNKAADIDTLDTLRAQIDEREWENGRRDKLVQTIDAKMAKLSEKLFAEEGK